MTGHYMLCKVLGSFEKVVQELSRQYGSIRIHNEQWNLLEGRVAVVLCESYFFRTNSNVAILMILKEVGVSETELELISCAGASGLLDLSLGAHRSYVHQIKDSLEKAGLGVVVVKEISNYPSGISSL